MWVIDGSGRELNAAYGVERDGPLLALVLESEGGRTSPGRPPRNHEYREAFELLLSRLKERGAVLHDALVDSAVTRRLPEAQRRLIDQPIQLAAEDDIAALRRRLSTAQSTIGQSPTARKSGNGSKRIRLRLSVPGYSTEDITRLGHDLAYPTSPVDPEHGATVTPDTGTTALPGINEWWAGDATERYWMEITNRPDVGSNVRALKKDGGGREYWSYALVTALRPGDVVLHWHKDMNGKPGIIGYSTAVDGPYDDELDWDARGSYGRQRTNAGLQPAWRYELTGYTALAEPIGQASFQRAEDRLKQIRDELQAHHPDPLYFPFAFFKNRPLRAMQAYLVKFPIAVLQAVPELAVLFPSVRPAAQRSLQPRATTGRPRSTGAGYIADPVLRRAIEQHAVRSAMELYDG